MALINHNTTLEYANNTVTLHYYDDVGGETDFDTDTVFNIQRKDDPNINYSVRGIINGNKAVFQINPPDYLKKEGDKIYDYDHPSYDHIYSVKSPNVVYMTGKLNLIGIA